MNSMLILQAFLSLAFVLGLVLIVFWLIKFCEMKGLKNPLLKKMNVVPKLFVMESKRIDAKNTLALVRCEDEEYLLLLGNTQNLILQNKKVQKNG